MYYQVLDADNCKRKPVMVDQNLCPDIKASIEAILPKSDYGENGETLSFRDIIQISLGFVSTYVEEIANANFRHTSSPDDIRCTNFCPYRRICRKDKSKLIALGE
jgi:hypothetical protein